MRLILTLARQRYRATVVDYNKKIFLRLERQRGVAWLVLGEMYLPGVQHTDLCIVTAGACIIVYDPRCDTLFTTDQTLVIHSRIENVLGTNLPENAQCKYGCFFLSAEDSTLLLVYEEFYREFSMSYLCFVKGKVLDTHIDNGGCAQQTQQKASPKIEFDSVAKIEVHNYQQTKGMILHGNIAYTLVQYPLSKRCFIRGYIVQAFSSASPPRSQLLVSNIGPVYFFVYRRSLMALEFNSENSRLYHFVPGPLHTVSYIRTEVPLQVERDMTHVYAANDSVYTDSNCHLLKLSKFIYVPP